MGLSNSDEQKINKLKFRGDGWPGTWSVEYDSPAKSKELSYSESWGFLQRYRQWRCYICPDHSGEFADISVGDPWYNSNDNPENRELGSSLVVARTQAGLRFLAAAQRKNYVRKLAESSDLIDLAQPNLKSARGALWARLIILRAFRVPTPVSYTHLTLPTIYSV